MDAWLPWQPRRRPRYRLAGRRPSAARVVQPASIAAAVAAVAAVATAVGAAVAAATLAAAALAAATLATTTLATASTTTTAAAVAAAAALHGTPGCRPVSHRLNDLICNAQRPQVDRLGAPLA